MADEGGPREISGELTKGEDGVFPIGTYLARQRKLRALSLEELEHITRIPRRSLERLEAGAFDGESDGFARGFVRAVAEALGLDAEDATMLMLSEPAAEPRSGFHLAMGWWFGSVVVAASLIATGFWFTQGPSPEAQPAAPAEVSPLVRRDPVRALAEAEGLLSMEGAPAASEGDEGPRALTP